MAASSAVNLANNRATTQGGGSESASANLIPNKEKQPQGTKKPDFMQTQQAMSLGSFKKFVGSGNDNEDDWSEASPSLQYSRNQSRF